MSADVDETTRRTLGDLIARLDDAAARLAPSEPERGLFQMKAQEIIDHGGRRDGMIGPEPPWPALGDDRQLLLAAIVQSYAWAIGMVGAGPWRDLFERQSADVEAQVAGA